MKIELTEQDIKNTIEFLGRAELKGVESFAMAMLIQTYRVALQPVESEEDEAPAASNGTTPKAKAKETTK